MKNRVVKCAILLVISIIFALNTKAQYKHELFITGGGGISMLKYNTDFGNSDYKLGGFFGIGYNYFFATNWGIGTGTELSFYNGAIDIGSFNSTQFNVNDRYNDPFDYRSVVSNYSETQRATFVNIPLMFIYQTNGWNKYFISAGARLAIPLKGSYKVAGAVYTNEGYFTNRDNTLISPEFMGFGTFVGDQYNGDIKFKTSVMASIETGIKWRINECFLLYTGIYLDYGLTDIIKDSRNQSIVSYNTEMPIIFNNNSVLASSYAIDNQSIAFTNKVIPLSTGIKLRFAFDICGSKKLIDNTTQPDAVISNMVDRKRDSQMNPAYINIQQKELLTEDIVEQKAEQLIDEKLVFAENISGYDINVTKLSEIHKARLDRKIELLKQYPSLNIICEGHTCDLGSNTIDNNVGLKRAEAVRDYLVENGIETSRIKATSKGKSTSIFPNIDEENRRKNRRVEFIVK